MVTLVGGLVQVWATSGGQPRIRQRAGTEGKLMATCKQHGPGSLVPVVVLCHVCGGVRPLHA
jgi:hypothetical protein